jgi:hypothetical protein
LDRAALAGVGVISLEGRDETMAEESIEQLKARIAELEAEKASNRRTGELQFKVSEKGAVSVYGLGRFPVTLYYEQWVRLLDCSDRLRGFMDENRDRLKLKEK